MSCSQPRQPPEGRSKLRNHLPGEQWELVLRTFPSILAIHLLEHDEEASRSGNSTKSYENVKFERAERDGDGEEGCQWMLLTEFSDPFEAPWASYPVKSMDFANGLTENGVDLAQLKEEFYGLVIAMEE